MQTHRDKSLIISQLIGGGSPTLWTTTIALLLTCSACSEPQSAEPSAPQPQTEVTLADTAWQETLIHYQKNSSTHSLQGGSN